MYCTWCSIERAKNQISALLYAIGKKAIFILSDRVNTLLGSDYIYYAVYGFLFLEVHLSTKNRHAPQVISWPGLLDDQGGAVAAGWFTAAGLWVVEKSHCGMTLTSKDSCWWIQENVVVWFFKLLAQRHRVNVPIDGYRGASVIPVLYGNYKLQSLHTSNSVPIGLIDLVLSLVWNLLLAIIILVFCNPVIM